MPELRKNPVTREWVIVAETRSQRPLETTIPHESSISKGPAFDPDCPFCPGNESQTPREVLAFRSTPGAGDTPGWNVRVTPNKYPALLVEGDLARRGLGMYDCMNGIGAHEVVIETPAHNLPFADLPTAHCADVFWACRERFVDLSRDRRFKYILFFRNEGRVAGVSLDHPHSQIIALPMVPMDVMAEIEGMSHYAEYRDRCPYCDMVDQERESADRVLFETASYLIFEPFASRFAFETWVVPKIHQPSFAELDYDAMPAVAEAVQGALRHIDRCLGSPPYNLAMHTMPINTSRPEDFHWHIQITPRLAATGGFELGTGVYINPISPEESARRLRESAAETR
ncbi:MAG TPA: galactose-1-phosphate uridylyltransferase [Armatimonadota bacterium]|nr:galactose-1-phosphate uridylyltransferase [Armatimonadota bacterium]